MAETYDFEGRPVVHGGHATNTSNTPARPEPPGLAAAVEALAEEMAGPRHRAISLGHRAWLQRRLRALLAAHTPEPREAQGGAGDGLEAVIAGNLNIIGPMRHIFGQTEANDALAVLLDQEVEHAAHAVRAHLGLTPGGGAR